MSVGMSCEQELLRNDEEFRRKDGQMKSPLNVTHNHHDIGLLRADVCHNRGTPHEYGWADERNPLMLGRPVALVLEQEFKSHRCFPPKDR